jgi:hypothetical protein
MSTSTSTTPVSAPPGWYALLAELGPIDAQPVRRQIVAWLGEEGDALVVQPGADRPLVRLSEIEDEQHKLIGLHNDQHAACPPGPELGDTIRQLHAEYLGAQR